MIRRILACMLLGISLSFVACADTLVVAGRLQQLASPLIVDGEEILAPLVPSLRLLGVKAAQQGGTVTLTAPDARSLTLTMNSTTAHADGKPIAIGAAPRDVNGTCYLPVRTLAPFLNAVVRYQPEQQTLAISPYLTVSCQQRPDGGVTVLARSTAPVQFTSKTLADPPRAYLDFKHVSLGNTEPQIDIQAGGVQRLRLAQYSTQPDTVRVVVDFETMRTLKTTVTDAGRQVALEIGADAPPAAPMPGLETPAAPAAPVAEPPANAPRLFDVALESLSPQQSQLTLGTRGEPAVTGSYDAKTRVLTLRAPAAVSTIPDAHLAALSDKLIKSVAVRESTPAGVEVVVTFARDYGYLITRDATGVRVLIGVFDLGDMTVVLDAGHGGYDSGAVGRKGTCEKDINLDIILRTAKLLREAGVKVVLSRSDDTFIPLPERSKLANSRQVDLFISVHCNSTPTRNSQSGTQVYYRTPQSIRLAEAMMTELAEGIKLKRGGVRNGNFHVIRETKMPSVLIETAFINNDVEEELLCQPEFRQKVAQSILNGLRRYAATPAWQQRRTDQAAAAPPAPASSESGQ